jgi:hypothetical protein
MYGVAIFGICGCHAMSVCDPQHGATTGQYLRVKSSLAHMARAEHDLSYFACRAEVVIPATLGFMRENETELCNHTGVCATPNAGDAVMNPNNYLRKPETTSEGGLRGLGIGHGVDGDDCLKTAMEACNETIDYHFRKIGALRPPTVVCVAADDCERCVPSPSQ